MKDFQYFEITLCNLLLFWWSMLCFYCDFINPQRISDVSLAMQQTNTSLVKIIFLTFFHIPHKLKHANHHRTPVCMERHSSTSRCLILQNWTWIIQCKFSMNFTTMKHHYTKGMVSGACEWSLCVIPSALQKMAKGWMLIDQFQLTDCNGYIKHGIAVLLHSYLLSLWEASAGMDYWKVV